MRTRAPAQQVFDSRPHRGPAGFTLVELLVVVSIATLLVALLAPALGAARARAVTTQCLSNLRTLGQAVSFYADEQRGAFPNSSSIPQPGGWLRLLEPYSPQRLAYRCAADRSDDWLNAQDSPAQQLINDRKTSFAINIYLTPSVTPPGGSLGSAAKYGFTRRELLRRPSDTICFGEQVETSGVQTTEDHLHADRWLPSPLTGLPIAPPGTDLALRRHPPNSENYVFADGHAATLWFEKTFALDAAQLAALVDQWNPAFRDEPPPDFK